MEREADLREQLRYAEEEVSTLLTAKKLRRTEFGRSIVVGRLVFIHLSNVFAFNTMGVLYPPSRACQTRWFLGTTITNEKEVYLRYVLFFPLPTRAQPVRYDNCRATQKCK